jgi:hypothetical protein
MYIDFGILSRFCDIIYAVYEKYEAQKKMLRCQRENNVIEVRCGGK